MKGVAARRDRNRGAAGGEKHARAGKVRERNGARRANAVVRGPVCGTHLERRGRPRRESHPVSRTRTGSSTCERVAFVAFRFQGAGRAARVERNFERNDDVVPCGEWAKRNETKRNRTKRNGTERNAHPTPMPSRFEGSNSAPSSRRVRSFLEGIRPYEATPGRSSGARQSKSRGVAAGASGSKPRIGRSETRAGSEERPR